MDISFSQSPSDSHDVIVICTSDSKVFGTEGTNLDRETGNTLSRAVKLDRFNAKKGETVVINAPDGTDANQLILVGLGEEKDLNALIAQDVGGKIYAALHQAKATHACVIVEGVKDTKEVAANIAYGLKLRSYSFDKYLTKKRDDKLHNVTKIAVVTPDPEGAGTTYEPLGQIAAGVFLARDVVTEPPNVLYPESYANIIKAELSALGASVKILGEKQLKKLGAGALLGVGQGSEKESQLVIIEWKGNKDSKNFPVSFVGKGVTFDTGGISLKPSGGMEDMKYDMGGSAAVVGVMKALAGRKANVNAVGVVGLVENMPSHNAQRPSDVVTSMSGQTIEVLNTDAEGRLVLADALWYAQEQYKPEFVVNLATLTGAIVVALGNEHAGLFSNSDELSEGLLEAGVSTNEKFWRFPLNDAYDKMIDSPIADMQNISSGRGAGSITAGQFLQRFIQEGTKWAHLDIAGVAWTKKTLATCPKGATGFGVRALDQWISKNIESSS